MACLLTGLALLLCPRHSQRPDLRLARRRRDLVLSDKAKDPSARSYSLSPSIDTTVRTTRPLSKRAAEYQGLIEEHAR